MHNIIDLYKQNISITNVNELVLLMSYDDHHTNFIYNWQTDRQQLALVMCIAYNEVLKGNNVVIHDSMAYNHKRHMIYLPDCIRTGDFVNSAHEYKLTHSNGHYIDVFNYRDCNFNRHDFYIDMSTSTRSDYYKNLRLTFTLPSVYTTVKIHESDRTWRLR